MIDPKMLVSLFAMTHRVVKLQTGGLTHEESLMQTPFGTNCLNWVVGHIMANRTNIETLMELQPVWSLEEAQRYRRGSAPVTGREEDGEIYSLDKMLHDFDRSQTQLVEALQGITPEDMAQPKGDSTLGERLAFFYFHETYHSGQLEIFRQLVGKEAMIK
jgi:hypothetical protein